MTETRREYILKIALSEDEEQLAKAVAAESGLPLATWARSALLREMNAVARTRDGSPSDDDGTFRC